MLAALARAEARRMLRNPVLWIGTGLTGVMVGTTAPEPGEWSGASYEQMMLASLPMMFAISVVVAASFHRERVPRRAGGAGRRGRTHRGAAPRDRRPWSSWRACSPHSSRCANVSSAASGSGPSPAGRPRRCTPRASWPSTSRWRSSRSRSGARWADALSRLVSVVPVLFVTWFLVSVYWLFSDPRVTPFSVLQVQPVDVEVGPGSTDPLTFPSHWLLAGPGDYSTRLVARVRVERPRLVARRVAARARRDGPGRRRAGRSPPPRAPAHRTGARRHRRSWARSW